MDWDKLRVFQAAADAGSFTHAGETLGLSQSAISRQVGALEADLGAPLFHRHARGLILTEQGEMLLGAVRDVEQHFALFCQNETAGVAMKQWRNAARRRAA